jgi:hypothetical protein
MFKIIVLALAIAFKSRRQLALENIALHLSIRFGIRAVGGAAPLTTA